MQKRRPSGKFSLPRQNKNQEVFDEQRYIKLIQGSRVKVPCGSVGGDVLPVCTTVIEADEHQNGSSVGANVPRSDDGDCDAPPPEPWVAVE